MSAPEGRAAPAPRATSETKAASGGRVATEKSADTRVEVTYADGIARITLNSPPLNILTTPVMHDLTKALDAAADARVVVLAARGKAFCAGVDVAEHTPDQAGPMLHRFHHLCRRLLAVETPVIAAVQGPALGGGCELIALCDVVLAARAATFGQPEIRLASFPPVAAAALGSLVGLRRAMSLILTGETVSAETAQSIGLVTRVVDDDRLEDETNQVAARLAGLSGVALRAAKQAALEEFRGRFDRALAEAEQVYLEELVPTEDAREGVAAFLEKRAPVWRHR